MLAQLSESCKMNPSKPTTDHEEMNATQKTTLQSAVKHGFTFTNDSFFKSYRAGKTAISALVSKGYLQAKNNEYGTEYVPTEKAQDFIKYGIEA